MMSGRRQLFFGDAQSASTDQDPWFNLDESPSFSSTSSRESSSVSSRDTRSVNTKTSLRDSVDDAITLNRGLLPPVLEINCEYENIYAELAFFVESKNYQFGNACPVNSPQKQKPHNARAANDLEASLKSVSLSGCLASVDEGWANKLLVDMERFAGKNYGRLMNAARSFNVQLKRMDEKKLFEFMQACRATKLSQSVFNNLFNKLTIIDLIVFLALVDKYPLYPAQSIYLTISDTLRSGKIDIFKAYKTFDTFLYKRTLTKDAFEPYRFQAEMRKIEKNREGYVEVEEVTDKMQLW